MDNDSLENRFPSLRIIECGVAECKKPLKQNGVCGMHAMRLWRTGSLGPSKDKYDGIIKTRDTGRRQRGYLESNTINDIRQKAKQRGYEWTLTSQQAFKLITSECAYCPFMPQWPNSRVGIDRVNNDLPYTPENCVSCCFPCNSAKGRKTVEEFIMWAKAVVKKAA